VNVSSETLTTAQGLRIVSCSAFYCPPTIGAPFSCVQLKDVRNHAHQTAQVAFQQTGTALTLRQFPQ
jgi:hypothetical protein